MTDPGVPVARRRALLAGAGAAGAVALAGCTTYNSNNGGIAGTQAPPATSPATSPAAASGTAGAAGGPAVLATTADVPVGGGKILAGPKIVITQPQAGAFHAFTAVCTHQGCLVDSVADGTIDCPCHGSKFSAVNGSVVNGPAAAPLAAVGIKVQGTSILQA